MDRTEKEQTVELLREKLTQSNLALLTELRGLTVPKMTVLRSELRRLNGEYLVVKNTLARIAVDGSKYQSMAPFLSGATGWVFARGDSMPIVKVAVKYASELEGFAIRAGVFEGDLLDAARIKELARLPSREQLLAQLLSAIQGTARKVVCILSEPSARVVRILNEVQKLKENT
jgi:large subunit ribosomal protein L10